MEEMVSVWVEKAEVYKEVRASMQLITRRTITFAVFYTSSCPAQLTWPLFTRKPTSPVSSNHDQHRNLGHPKSRLRSLPLL